jgi:hypothetical protein
MDIQQKIDAILSTNKSNLPKLPASFEIPSDTETPLTSASLREMIEGESVKDSETFAKILQSLDAEITRIDDSASGLLAAAENLVSNAFNATSTAGSQEIIDAIRERDEVRSVDGLHYYYYFHSNSSPCPLPAPSSHPHRPNQS